VQRWGNTKGGVGAPTSRSDLGDDGKDGIEGEAEDRNRHGGGGHVQGTADVRTTTISGGEKDGNVEEGMHVSFSHTTDTLDLAVDDGKTCNESVDYLEDSISGDDTAVDNTDISKWAEGAERAAMSEGG
jgi:hypothetical protein